MVFRIYVVQPQNHAISFVASFFENAESKFCHIYLHPEQDELKENKEKRKKKVEGRNKATKKVKGFSE